ncbi:DUF58 domain-containing protein [Halobacteriales archaeon QS_8_69_73]|nr:MAG: DUF58 domain-containing protein [Halobacteriales archaeon QS_8_69_73]
MTAADADIGTGTGTGSDPGGRFDAAAFTAVALLTVGAVLGNGLLFVAAVVPGVYLVAEAAASPPSPGAVRVERSIESTAVPPGRPTTVTLTVANEGDRPIPDCRLVDRPPEGATVVEGTARGCVSVRPGETASVSYAVVADHGDHEFDDPVARLRSLSAAGRRTARPSVDGDATLSCRQAAETPAVRSAARRRAGARAGDSPGRGVEFHSVREYRRGDDVSRVDWRRYAKTGDLSTVDFREPHAAGTVVVVDVRRPGRVGRAPGRPTAATLSVDAAGRLFERLSAAGDRVGLSALGVAAADVDVPVAGDRADRPWVPPGDGETTRTRTTAVLEAAADIAAERPSRPPPTVGDAGRRAPARPGALRARLPGSAAVVVATPLLDEEATALVETLAGADHPVLAVSPDVTGGDRPGGRVAGVERRLRLERLRARGVEVVDWDVAEPLSVAVEGSA